MRVVRSVLFTLALLGGAHSAFAQDPVIVYDEAVQSLVVRIPSTVVETKRPAALPALYAGLITANALDLYTTHKALGNGALEANPVMRVEPPAQIAIKAATTATSILLAERMWKKNRKAAIVLMAVMNGATAAVVAHNARHARR